jgi:hypothetical protein
MKRISKKETDIKGKVVNPLNWFLTKLNVVIETHCDHLQIILK